MTARLGGRSQLTLRAQPRRETIAVGENNRRMRGLIETALRRAGDAVILLDLARPDTSGLTVLDELKRVQRTRSIPVPRVGAFASPVPDQHACHAGAVIQKSFRMARLLAGPERALGSAGR